MTAPKEPDADLEELGARAGLHTLAASAGAQLAELVVVAAVSDWELAVLQLLGDALAKDRQAVLQLLGDALAKDVVEGGNRRGVDTDPSHATDRRSRILVSAQDEAGSGAGDV